MPANSLLGLARRARGEQPYSLQEKAYFLMGDAHGSRGDAQALINTYQKALSHYPDSYYSADMRFALGQTLFEREDLAGNRASARNLSAEDA